MTTTALELVNVTKRYDQVTAVDQLSLRLERGKMLVLLGSSGSGKTTTLRILAGLEAPDGGEVWLNGQRVAGNGAWLPPEDRKIGMVFQDYALFPHLTVNGNITFALKGMPAAARTKRIAELLDQVGLSTMGGRFPHQLSGGEQQRVALARALAASPTIVLLDEPFSNLDAALRRDVRTEICEILRCAEVTSVFVTHDQEEALSIADNVAIMRRGKLIQLDSPQNVYLCPTNREVAQFVGEANLLPGEARGGAVTCALGTLSLMEHRHGKVEVLIRPESLTLELDPQADTEISQVRFFGHDQIVLVRLPDGLTVQARTWARADLTVGAKVRLRVHQPYVIAFPL